MQNPKEDLQWKEELAATSDAKIDYDDKYILKNLMEGKTRDMIAAQLSHKSYRTLDMYMRRHGYTWDSSKQIYIKKPDGEIPPSYYDPSATHKVQRILSLFQAGIDPREVAKRVGMKDHRTVANYMKSKGYMWITEKQNYILLKGEQKQQDPDIELKTNLQTTVEKNTQEENLFDLSQLPSTERLERLLPMLEMMDRNKEKLAELLSISETGKIPRYVVGGVTITKSICMSHPLAQLVKEFSKEKNISQREIFEVAVIEFLKKYGYEQEVTTLFTT
jgi:hypothetical protein